MKKLHPLLIIIVISIIAFFATTYFKQNTGLQVIKDIPLAGGTNRLDYQSIDVDTNQLFISHVGSRMVHVFDLENQEITKNIPLKGRPYGIDVSPNLKKVFVGIGENNSVAVIDENSLSVTNYIPVGEKPDGIAFSKTTNKIFVSNKHTGTVSVIDANRNKHIEDIRVGGSVGNIYLDNYSKLVYSVSGDDNTLVEIDPTTDKVINQFKLAECSYPHGFYVDRVTHYVFITCQGNNALIVFDLSTNQIIASSTVGSSPDVLAYDEGLHHLYIAAESGILTIFNVQNGVIKKLSESFMAPHAHSVAVDQATHYVYMPLENINNKPVLRILKPL